MDWPPSAELSSDSEDCNPLPDLDKVSEDHPISPSEDVKTYDYLIRKVAASLRLSFSEPKTQVTNAVFNIMHQDMSSAVSLTLS